MTSAIGAILGAVITFFIVLVGLPPSPAALEDDAATLVLPGSELLQVGSNTGATMIVGWERWSTARFEDERSREVVHDLLHERARELGWTIDEVGANTHGGWIQASRWWTNADISAGPQFHRGEPLTRSRGDITVSRNEERRAVVFWGLVIAGGIGGGALGSWARERTEDDDPADIG